jgi:DNA-binding transcriptional MerR regulator
LKINELAKLTGLTAHTIRYYEKEGLLDDRHIKREANNYRNYSDETIDRLKLIKKFQNIGCTLTELKDVLYSVDNKVRTNQEIITWIKNKITEVENKQKEYNQMLKTLNSMLRHRTNLVK